MAPRVSILLATVGRPQLVGRAIRSVLAQTIDDFELLVLIDGPDPATAAVLAAERDPRVRIEQLPVRGGQAAALRVGLTLARAPWLAFLDDDDEWMPEKLECQLAVAERSRYAAPIVSCRFLATSPRGAQIWPRRPPDPGEDLSEYLFCRHSPFYGEGLLLHSTLLTATALARRIPFDARLPRHSDLDWVLRAVMDPEAGIEWVPDPEPLAIWHGESSHPRISTQPDWEFSRAWIVQRRAEVTPRAYASFLLTWVAANAVRQGCRRALPGLARDAFRGGAPDAIAIAVFLAIAALPRRSREALSFWATHRSRPHPQRAEPSLAPPRALSATPDAVMRHDSSAQRMDDRG